MKTIVTMTLNPAIDKSSSVAHVVAEQKLYCTPPRFEPGGGGVNVSRAIKKLRSSCSRHWKLQAHRVTVVR
jgi:6-phosphofructokinase 2